MMNVWRPVLPAAVAVAPCGSGGATGNAETAEVDSNTETQVAVDPVTGAQRSAVPVEGGGLKLNVLDGDRVAVSGGTVSWTDQSGSTVVTISLVSEQDGVARFIYDAASHMVRPVATKEKTGSQVTTRKKFMPRWWGWFYNISWGTLVCLPASVGASGVATPIAGIARGVACEAAGGALVTAISC